MKFIDLSPEVFQKAMFELKDRYPDIYEELMNRYFDEYRDCENPVLESYKNDPDEMWDAMSILDEFFKTK